MEGALFALRSFTLTLPIFGAGLFLVWSIRRNMLPRFNTPLDGRMKIGGARLFGDNKTWRGVLIYTAVSLLICYALFLCTAWLPEYVHPVYLQHPALVGLGFSLSYIAGELLNSFIKRRAGISPGHTSGSLVQEFIDNTDGTIITCTALVLFFGVSLGSVVLAAAFGFVMHLAVHIYMKNTGLKSQ